MTVLIVHRFESIEIQIRQAQLLLVALGADHGAAEAVLEQQTVRQTGDRVVGRLAADDLGLFLVLEQLQVDLLDIALQRLDPALLVGPQAVEFQEHAHFLPQDFGIHRRTEQDIHGAHAVTHLLLHQTLKIRRNEDDGNGGGVLVMAQLRGHFVTVHHRHLDVEQHQRDIVFLRRGDGFIARSGLDNLNAKHGKNLTVEIPVIRRVVHDQDFRQFVVAHFHSPFMLSN